MIDADRLCDFLIERFKIALDVNAHRTQDGQVLRFRPTSMERNHGFSVKLTAGWRSLDFRFSPDTYAIDLVRSMENADSDSRSKLGKFAENAVGEGAQFTMTINGNSVGATEPETWPENWRLIEFRLRKGNLPLDSLESDDPENEQEVVYPWAEKFFGCPLALMRLESTEISLPEGEEEGSVIHQMVKRYERSPKNRDDCIAIHGLQCKVCSFDFGKVYGDATGKGFIHVHHILPVSQLGGSYAINPVEDLVPVCPNCHSMLHRQNPPLTTDELRNIMRNEAEKKESPAPVD